MFFFFFASSAIACGGQATRKYEQIVYSSHTSLFLIKSLSHSFSDGRWRSTGSRQSVRLAPPAAFGARLFPAAVEAEKFPFSFVANQSVQDPN